MAEVLFVYGTLKRGFPNHRFLEGAEFLGRAETASPLKLVAGGIPFLLPQEGPSPVRGELYAVDEVTLARVDRLEGHPHAYRRERIPVLCRGYRIPAWVYVFPHETDAAPVPHGEYGPNPEEVFERLLGLAATWCSEGYYLSREGRLLQENFVRALREAFRFGWRAWVIPKGGALIFAVWHPACPRGFKVEALPEEKRLRPVDVEELSGKALRSLLAKAPRREPFELLRAEGTLFVRRGSFVEVWPGFGLGPAEPFFSREDHERYQTGPVTLRDLVEVEEVLAALGYAVSVPEAELRLEELGGVPLARLSAEPEGEEPLSAPGESL